MASRSKDTESALTRAAVALDTEIVRYEQAVKELAAMAINSEKTLQRARARLEQCAELEPRLAVALRAFAEAMQETQARQQRCMEATVLAAKTVEQRFVARRALLERMKALGERANAVNEPVVAAMKAGPDTNVPTAQLLASLQEIGELTASIIEEAEVLARSAREDDWVDIERDADTLKQQLQAARNKLLVARRNVATRAPS